MSATMTMPIPADVIALAVERKAEAILPQVIDLTRRVFPDSPIRIYVLEDPECADYRGITIEVQIKPGTDVEAMYSARLEWNRGTLPIFATLSWPTFALHMVTNP